MELIYGIRYAMNMVMKKYAQVADLNTFDGVIMLKPIIYTTVPTPIVANACVVSLSGRFFILSANDA